MNNANVTLPEVVNEPVLAYAPGSRERARLVAELDRQYGEKIEIPLIIGDKEVRTPQTADVICPHEHGHVLATRAVAGRAEAERAIAAALDAKPEWERFSWEERAAIFLKAAELL
ncbi:MAG TPA: aldehyde dehydrogenase family protein, partial [Spirochaetia bacterium]|nr:aldehyde dehydrogenase family protein [Spirochaetia bacterium]